MSESPGRSEDKEQPGEISASQVADPRLAILDQSQAKSGAVPSTAGETVQLRTLGKSPTEPTDKPAEGGADNDRVSDLGQGEEVVAGGAPSIGVRVKDAPDGTEDADDTSRATTPDDGHKLDAKTDPPPRDEVVSRPAEPPEPDVELDHTNSADRDGTTEAAGASEDGAAPSARGHEPSPETPDEGVTSSNPNMPDAGSGTDSAPPAATEDSAANPADYLVEKVLESQVGPSEGDHDRASHKANEDAGDQVPEPTGKADVGTSGQVAKGSVSAGEGTGGRISDGSAGAGEAAGGRAPEGSAKADTEEGSRTSPASGPTIRATADSGPNTTATGDPSDAVSTPRSGQRGQDTAQDADRDPKPEPSPDHPGADSQDDHQDELASQGGSAGSDTKVDTSDTSTAASKKPKASAESDDASPDTPPAGPREGSPGGAPPRGRDPRTTPPIQSGPEERHTPGAAPPDKSAPAAQTAPASRTMRLSPVHRPDQAATQAASKTTGAASTTAPAKAATTTPETTAEPTATGGPAAATGGASAASERMPRPAADAVPLARSATNGPPPPPAAPPSLPRQAPPPPVVPPAPPSAHRPPSERTQQQELPADPANPLRLLAELTNTPPPKQTLLRLALRRVKIWSPLALLLIVIFVVAQLVRPLPQLALTMTAADSHAFKGSTPSLPWPAEGQSAVTVQGLGSLGARGGEKPRPIASVTKVMTAYVILQEHPLKLGAKGPVINVDQEAQDHYERGLPESESVIKVNRGQRISQYEALQDLLIPSANNIARLLARWDSGTEKAFSAKMNEAAKKLGMTNTEYTDPSGLDATTVSTAVDQVKLAEAAMNDPVFRQIVDTGAYRPLNYNTDIFNHNSLLHKHGVIGLKTGNSTAAGGNLLFAAESEVGGTKQLVFGAVLGQRGQRPVDNAISASGALVVAAQNALTATQVIKKGQVVGEVDDGMGTTTPVVATKDVTVVGWTGLTVRLRLQSDGEELPRESPAGARVGTLAVGNGSTHVRVPVAVESATHKPSFGARLVHLF